MSDRKKRPSGWKFQPQASAQQLCNCHNHIHVYEQTSIKTEGLNDKNKEIGLK